MVSLRFAIFAAVAGVMLVGDAGSSPTEAQPRTGARPARTLCVGGETTIFQCRVGTRLLSVCGGRASGQAYAQYRFGTPARTELTYPAQRQGAGTMQTALIPFSGGGEAQIHFTNGATQYVVYSRTVRTGFGRGGNNPQFSAGVNVLRGGRTISRRGCSDGDSANVDLAAAEPFIPQGEPVDSE